MKFFSNTSACVLVLLAVTLAGCESSSSTAQPQPTVDDGGGSVGRAGGAAAAAGAGGGATTSGTEINRPGAQVPREPGRGASGEWIGGPSGTLVIYFDYDRSAIRAEYGEVLQAHGAWLAANQDRKLVLQGHADERGTPEYNLALGSRRANAVGQALTALGAEAWQWSAVSFGEEKPAAGGANEVAWSRNRRVELVYD